MKTMLPPHFRTYAKNILISTFALLLLQTWSNGVLAQCSSTTAAPSSPQAADNSGAGLSWAQTGGRYMQLTGCSIGTVYQLSSDNNGDFFTVRTGNANNGTVITSGTSPITFTATATTVYVTTNNNSGCSTAGGTRNITVAVVPTITSVPSSACAGADITITGTGLGGVNTVKVHGVTASFTINSSTSVTVTIPATATTGTIVLTCDGGTATSSSITIHAAPTNINPTGTTTICSGSSTNISMSGTISGTSYQLRNNADNSNVGSAVAGGSSITLPTGALSSTTTFNVLATINATGCSAQMNNTVTVTVNAIPAATCTNSSQSVCSGSSFTTMSLGTSPTITNTTFAWTRNNTASVTGIAASGSGSSIAGVALTNSTGSPVTVTFTITPTGPTPTFCVGSAITATVTVNPLPTALAVTGTATICAGTSTNIQIANSQSGVNYQLRNNSGNGAVGSAVAGTGGTITLPTGNLASTTTFNVLATNATTSCSAQMSNTVTVTVSTAATVTPGGPNNACQSSSPTAITLSGASVGGSATTGAWSIFSGGGSLSSTAQTGSPAAVTYTPAANFNGTVTLTLTSNDPSGVCGAVSGTRTITVNTLPSAPTISVNYCAGNGNFTLTSSSATTYAWSTTGATTQSITDNVAGVYFVTITNAATCSASASVSVGGELVTNGNFSAGNTGFTTAYINNQVSLQTEGTYAITNNANTQHNLFYGTDHDNPGTGVFMAINGSPSQATAWSETVTVTPNTTYYFSAYAMSLNAITPYAQLQFSINGSLQGSATTLNAGATGTGGPFNWQRLYVTWNSGANTSAIISIVDENTVLNGNDFGIDDVSFSSLPPYAFSTVVSSNTPVCVGNAVNLNATPTGGYGALTYSWSGPSSFSSLSQSPSISSATTSNSGTYNVTVTDNAGCVATASASVTVNALPTDKTPTAVSSTLCSGSSTNIQIPTSQSGVSYQLRNNATNANVGSAVSGTGFTINLPTGALSTTTTFNVYATNTSTTCGVQMVNTVTVTINQKSGNPTSATATASSICKGSSTQLTLNGGGGGTGETVKWYTGSCGGTLAATGNGVTVSPLTTTTYFGRYEDGAPCSSNSTCASIMITVSNPSTANAGGPNTVCQSPSPAAITLSGASVGGGATTGAWSILSGGGSLSSILQTASPASVTYTPAANTSGTVTLQLTSNSTGACAAATTTRTINVNAAPAATASSNTPVCTSSTLSFSAAPTGQTSYLWSGPNGFSSGIYNPSISTPTTAASGTYNVTVTGSNGCSSTASTSATVITGINGQWIGAVSTDWNTAANWCSGVPTPTTDVIIPAGTTYPPTISTSANCHNLNVNTGATLTVVSGGDLHLYGDLDIDGSYNHTAGTLELVGSSTQHLTGISAYNLVMNNNHGAILQGNLIVTNSLTLSNGIIKTGIYAVEVTDTVVSAVGTGSDTAYINGYLQRAVGDTGLYEFPVGTTQYYELAEINISGNSRRVHTGFDNLTAYFTAGDSGCSAISTTNPPMVNGSPITNLLNGGYWTIHPDTSSYNGIVYTATLYEKGYTNAPASASQMAVIKRSNCPSAWQSIGTHNNVTQSFHNGAAIAVRSQLSTFSDFGIGFDEDFALPVELSYIQAEAMENTFIRVSWGTALEINNSGFEVQRSTDGQTWTKIGWVTGHDNSTQTIDYNYDDHDALSDVVYYYRLKQIDNNGNFKYTSAVTATLTGGETFTVNELVPNPTANSTYLIISSSHSQEVDIVIYDMFGQRVMSNKQQLENATSNKIDLDVRKLVAGTYTVIIQSASTRLSKKLVVAR